MARRVDGEMPRFAGFRAERIYHGIHRVGIHRVKRVGGNFVRLRRVITGVGELWEFLDRI